MWATTAASPDGAAAAQSRALAEGGAGNDPAELKRHLGGVVIRVDEFPDEETEREMALENPFEKGLLLGRPS